MKLKETNPSPFLEKLDLTHGTPDAGSGNLHSMALLTAFLENDDFRQVTSELPDLLRYKNIAWRLAA